MSVNTRRIYVCFFVAKRPVWFCGSAEIVPNPHGGPRYKHTEHFVDEGQTIAVSDVIDGGQKYGLYYFTHAGSRCVVPRDAVSLAP